MAPVAAGFMVIIAAATIFGLFVGAVGGAVVWRLRLNVFLGLLLTAIVFALLHVAERGGISHFLGAQLIWGLPPMTLSFLIGVMAARRLEARRAFRPVWTALAAFGIALITGLLFLLLFRGDLKSVPPVTSIADAVLVAILLWVRPRIGPAGGASMSSNGGGSR